MIGAWEGPVAFTDLGTFQIVSGLNDDFFVLAKKCLFWISNQHAIKVWKRVEGRHSEPRSIFTDSRDSNVVYVCCGDGIWKIDLMTKKKEFGYYPLAVRIRGGIRYHEDKFFLFDNHTAWKAKADQIGMGFLTSATKYAQIQVDCIAINQQGTCIYAANKNFIYELPLTTNSITNIKYSFPTSFAPKTRFSFITTIAVDESERFLYIMDVDYKHFFAMNLKTLVVKLLMSFESYNYGSFTLGRDGFLYALAVSGCLYKRKLPVTKLAWSVSRVVWIGNMKNSPSECLFAQLPRDLIKEILLLCLDM